MAVARSIKTPQADPAECKHSGTEKEEELSRAHTDVLSDEEPCPVGIATDRGGKNNQEDAYFIGGRVAVRMTLNGYSGPYEACYGIFDGHGGDRASRYCAEHVFDRIDESFQSNHTISTALMDGIQRLDDEFCTVARRTRQLWLSRSPTIANAPTGVAHTMGLEDGTTCLIAIIRDRVLHVANVGDSRAIVATKNGKCIPMSIDQKPDRKDERDRLEAKGAFVTGPPMLAKIMWPMARFMDVPRVNGALAMSRSIGDISLKDYITSEPEVQTHTITSDDKYLIMASDGLWDVMSNRAAAKMASKYSDAQLAAEALLKHALSRRTQDNTTVLVVDVSGYK